jgi:hypothetical protein
MTARETTPSRAGAIWAYVPALLLGTMLIGLGTMAYVAIDDPSFALESNYYDKAVHWDQNQQRARDSQALGLNLALGAPLSVSKAGKVTVQLRVTDRATVAFSGADVALDAFPNAYANRVQRLILHEVEPGLYVGELSQGVRGLWELRVVVTQGVLRYDQILRADVSRGDAA